MSTMVQIRNVPEETHRQLKARAALAGMSMSEFMLKELQHTLQRPTRAELMRQLERLPPVELDPSPAELIRRERDLR